MPPELNKFAADLLESLKQGEFVELARFARDKSQFTQPEFAQGVRDFLYGGSFLHTKGYKSVSDIVRMGHIRYRVLMEVNGQRATIFYYPAQYAAEAEHGLGFFKRTWMMKSFACEVNLLPNQGWLIKYGFCFAESEGPFPPPDIG